MLAPNCKIVSSRVLFYVRFFLAVLSVRVSRLSADARFSFLSYLTQNRLRITASVFRIFLEGVLAREEVVGD